MKNVLIERNSLLNRLIAKRENGFVKVITGVRRCGKSFLLFVLYRQYLLKSGVPERQIVTLALDNVLNAKYRDPLVLAEYLNEKTADSKKTYYVFLDEIQFVGAKAVSDNPKILVTFYDVLNSLLQKGNADIYVTGSNSKMLSKDVATEFRGRGDELHVTPLSFAELYHFHGGEKTELFSDYLMYGGMPLAVTRKSEAEKRKYLADLFKETFLKDIRDRYNILFPAVLEMVANELSSSVGSLTNASKLAAALKSEGGTAVGSETVSAYLEHMVDAFLFSRADRYDVKGKRYFSYPSKFYCVDPGLRNARLNFRQIEESHLMENVIFNELISLGYSVDVGVVESVEAKGGKQQRITREIDFVVNAEMPGERFYIQSALTTDDSEKMEQEIRPFLKLRNDFTKRILISKTLVGPWTDQYGILHIGVYDFLLGGASTLR